MLPVDAKHHAPRAISYIPTRRSSDLTEITVNNVAPANVVLTPSPATINENDSTTVSGSFTDPGTVDTHTVDRKSARRNPKHTVISYAVLFMFTGSYQYLATQTVQSTG